MEREREIKVYDLAEQTNLELFIIVFSFFYRSNFNNFHVVFYVTAWLHTIAQHSQMRKPCWAVTSVLFGKP